MSRPALLLTPSTSSARFLPPSRSPWQLPTHLLAPSQVKTALVEIVYEKSLRLSNSARQTKSVGEIVTLMQVGQPVSRPGTWSVPQTGEWVGLPPLRQAAAISKRRL